jgi:hypothetical protein
MKKGMLNLFEGKHINDEYNISKPIFKMLGLNLREEKGKIIICDQKGKDIGYAYSEIALETNKGALKTSHKSNFYEIELQNQEESITIQFNDTLSAPFINAQIKKCSETNSSVFFSINYRTLIAYMGNFYIPNSASSANCSRHLKYTDINKSYGKFSHETFIEYKAENNGYYKKIELKDIQVWADKFVLTADTNEEGKKAYNTYFTTGKEVSEIAINVLRTEDAKFTIKSVLTIVENNLPGFIDYIKNNMTLFKELMVILASDNINYEPVSIEDIKKSISTNANITEQTLVRKQ